MTKCGAGLKSRNWRIAGDASSNGHATALLRFGIVSEVCVRGCDWRRSKAQSGGQPGQSGPYRQFCKIHAPLANGQPSNQPQLRGLVVWWFVSGFRLILSRLVASFLCHKPFVTHYIAPSHIPCRLRSLLNLFSRSMKAACFHSALYEA